MAEPKPIEGVVGPSTVVIRGTVQAALHDLLATEAGDTLATEADDTLETE